MGVGRCGPAAELVEFTPHGQFVGQFSVDPEPGGAFGLAMASTGGEVRFAAVNDNANTLDVWTFQTQHTARRDSLVRAAGDTVNPVALEAVAFAMRHHDHTDGYWDFL